MTNILPAATGTPILPGSAIFAVKCPSCSKEHMYHNRARLPKTVCCTAGHAPFILNVSETL